MSDYERVSGKVIRMVFPHTTDKKEMARQILVNELSETVLGSEDPYEILMDNYYDNYFWVESENTFFKICEYKEEDPYDNICVSTKEDEDGKIAFLVHFHNGGMPLSEAIEEALKPENKL